MNRTSLPTPQADRDARAFAVDVIRDVALRRLALDERLQALTGEPAYRALSPADQGLARAIATSAIRGLGLLRKTIGSRMKSGLPQTAPLLEPTLIAGAAQILFLDVPDYAAVDTAVAALKDDRRAERYAGLANAILRGIARDQTQILAEFDPLEDNTPVWLAERWRAAYGEDRARAIAAVHAQEPPLDLTAPRDAPAWAERLGGTLLAQTTIRLRSAGAVPALDGFADGAWWVQDLAASLPARLLAPSPGDTILDLCAAPGGKTLQLASAGATVVAVDRSRPRMNRLEDNLRRLNLTAECVVADALTFSGRQFDKILLDAPCSATGTIRRNPDVAWNKTLADIAALTDLQSRLLDHAWTLLSPDGTLVYATCSLEREEGEAQLAAFLKRTPGARIEPILPATIGALPDLVGSGGVLRALPSHMVETGGCDGFFAVRLRRDH